MNNPWYDYSLAGGLFDIKMDERKARFFDEGTTKTNTTTLAQVGRAVAKLLSLPITAGDSSPSLSDYKNGYLYISSFLTTQREILSSVQRVTGTTDKDWTISKQPVQEVIAEGWQSFNATGQPISLIPVMYGVYFSAGQGGNYEHKTANKALGLPVEDLDEATRDALST